MEGPGVGLDHEAEQTADKVGANLAGAEIEGHLRLDVDTGLDAQRPEHRLERVGSASVGMPQHASYGGRACPTYVDGLQLHGRHVAVAERRVGDRQRLGERQDPCAVEDGAQGSGHPVVDLVIGEVAPVDRDA
jgi:hypothetical protein